MAPLRHFACLAIFAMTVCSGAFAKDVAVVLNKANDTKSLSPADLAKLLKGPARKWGTGLDVIVIMRDPDTPEMRVVLQKVFGMSADQMKVFTAAANQGRPSPAFVFADSDGVVIKMVASTAGAVGFVDVYSINSSVSVVKLDGKMPLEPGYALHGVW